jgi:CheY-like chemotaxis protein
MSRISSAGANASRGEARPLARGRHPLRASSEQERGGRGDGRASRGSHDARRSPLPRDLLTGLHVLVVDDDVASVEYFAAALTHCGARVITAFSAREGLEMLREARPDVVLSDIAMPGGDGYWMLQEMQNRLGAEAKRIPVVAATAYGREHSRERTLAAGFADHLAKPVEPETLCRTIARAVGRA